MNISLGPVLGRGAYGIVRQGTTSDGSFCAVKILSKRSVKSSDLVRIRREIAILKEVQHRHIIGKKKRLLASLTVAGLLDVVETKSSICLVMEFCGGGELCNYVRSKGHLTEEVARYFMKQLVSAISYLHAAGIVHRQVVFSLLFSLLFTLYSSLYSSFTLLFAVFFAHARARDLKVGVCVVFACLTVFAVQKHTADRERIDLPFVSQQ